MERRRIPKYLLSQIQFLNWELDEIMIFFIPVFFGILTNTVQWTWILGYFAMKFYVRMKYKKQAGYLKHRLYSLGLYNMGFPDYWKKELVR